MLVLSRKPGERVVIGGEISVTVLEVRGSRVRLGFSGPPEIPIVRQEVEGRRKDESALAVCADSC